MIRIHPSAIGTAILTFAFAFAARADDETCDPAITTCEGAHELTQGRFGGLDLSFGLWVRRPSTRGTMTANAPSGASWAIPASDLSPISDTMIDVQARIYLASPLYFGVGASIGWTRARSLDGTYDDHGVPTAFSTNGDGTSMTVTGIVGALLYENELLDLRAEVAFGLDVVSVDLTTPMGCSDADGNSAACSATRFGFIAEPRVAVDFWIAPWMMLDAWAGVDAWPLGGASVGTAIVIPFRPRRF